jgi:hypothetical protein
MILAWRTFRAGYDGRSRRALATRGAVYLVVGVTWRAYIDLSRGMDWLLAGIWLGMTALLCWRVDPRRDLVRAGVGLAGGLLIEAWGTATLLWTYWTTERPPLWILPAWPVAALAIDRLARMLDPVVPRRGVRLLHATLLPAFVVWMTAFAWPTVDLVATRLAIAAMVGVLLLPGDRREDLLLFLAGSLLGVFLEYWGTSRHCWTYWTHEIPPPQAVVAHGFASVAFARGARGVDAAYAFVSTRISSATAASRPASTSSRTDAQRVAGGADQSTTASRSTSTSR